MSFNQEFYDKIEAIVEGAVRKVVREELANGKAENKNLIKNLVRDEAKKRRSPLCPHPHTLLLTR